MLKMGIGGANGADRFRITPHSFVRLQHNSRAAAGRESPSEL